MFLDMAIFAILAYRYKYNYFSSDDADEDKKKDVPMGAIEGKEGGHTNPSYKDD